MNKKIFKEMFNEKLPLTIISFIIACIIWIVVFNISNPVITKTKTVELNIQNENIIYDAGQTYEIITGNTVVVSYDVRIRDEHKIKNSDFNAYIDLSDLYSVTGAVPISVDVVSNREKIIGTPTAKPTVAKVKTEDIQRKEFHIFAKTNGKPIGGLSVGSVKVEPTDIFVSGPVSLIGQIDSVGIDIDVFNAKENVKGSMYPIFYDANGNVINFDKEEFMPSETDINYEVILLKGKTVEFDFNVEGVPDKGYKFDGVESETKSILVRGLKEDLEKLDKINVSGELLNIDGLTQSKVVTFDVRDYLPENITTSGDTMVSIVLKIDSLYKDMYELRFSDIVQIGKNNEYLYKIEPERIVVSISGSEERFENFNSGLLKASIDLTGMEKGEHNGILEFDLPDGFSVESYTPFDVEVVDAIDTIEEKDDESLKNNEITTSNLSMSPINENSNVEIKEVKNIDEVKNTKDKNKEKKNKQKIRNKK